MPQETLDSRTTVDRGTLEPPPDPSPVLSSPWPARLAALAATLTSIGVITGGGVTSTHSGYADESWPTFSGSWIPPFHEMFERPDLLLEHGHRLIMGAVAPVLLVCLAALWRERKRRPDAWRLGVWALALYLVPAVLGGIHVLMTTPPPTGVIHLGLAMLALGAAIALTIVTGSAWAREPTRIGPDSARSLASTARGTLIVVFIQAVLGAVPRQATTDFGGKTLVLIGDALHIVWAFVAFTAVFVLVGRVVGQHGKIERFYRPACVVLLLAVLQIFLGFTTWLTQPKEPKVPGEATFGLFELIATVHQAFGVLMFVVLVVLYVRIRRVASLSIATSTPADIGGKAVP